MVVSSNVCNQRAHPNLFSEALQFSFGVPQPSSGALCLTGEGYHLYSPESLAAWRGSTFSEAWNMICLVSLPDYVVFLDF